MAELVNLRQFRKKQQQEKVENEAQQNRIIFGQTKLEKQFAKRHKDKNQNFLTNQHLSVDKGDKDDN